MANEREILESAYRNFNARNIEAVISRMHTDVEWANGMEGGHVHGKDETTLTAPIHHAQSKRRARPHQAG